MRYASTTRAFWWEGVRCGLINLPRCRERYALVQSLRLVLCPVDLWRYHEFQAVVTAYQGECKVLDVGSPKLLGLLLARRYGARVVTTDIVETLAAECALYRFAAGRSALVPHCGDARSLPFGDASFPFIYSVSVIEHIAGDGDTRAAREMARVLRPGGRAVVTTPLVPRYHERWVDRDPYGKQERNAEGKVFFSRYYDWATLNERVIAPSGLRVAAAMAWQEAESGWYERYCAHTGHPGSPVTIVTKLLDPLWACARLVPIAPPDLTRHGMVALALVRD